MHEVISSVTVTAFDDLIDQIAKFRSFEVDGRVYTAEAIQPTLAIRASQLVDEIAICAAHTAYWGTVVASAQAQLDLAEASFTAWKAGQYSAAKDLEWEVNGKAKRHTDESAKAAYRQQDGYRVWVERIAEFGRALACAQSIQHAFRAKERLLSTMAESLRSESGGYYKVVEASRNLPARTPVT